MNFSQIVHPINSELEKMEAELTHLFDSDIPLARSVTDHLLRARGKRLRPALLILSARSCGYNGGDAARAAAIVELAHTATLIHDDLIDSSQTRRGQPTVHVRWDSSVSVIMGDWLYSKVFEFLIEQDMTNLIAVLVKATIQMCRAEMLEIQNRYRLDFSEGEYLDLVNGKTAALISASTEIGPILAGSANGLRPLFSRFGTDVGMAFQLSDDLLDYIGEEGKLGKPTGSDLRDGKITLPLISAFRNAPNRVRKEMEALIVDSDYDGDSWTGVQSFVREYGGVDYTRQTIRGYLDQAKSTLADIPGSAFRDHLERVVDFVVDRKS
jgi:octaprenyl-diphosphate synthase